MLAYDEKQSELQNVDRLALHHAKVVRDLEEKRGLVAGDPTPGIGDIRRREADDQLDHARLHAEASAAGLMLHDPRDISACNPEHQTWRAKLAPLGLIVSPDQFASIHASEKTEGGPLKVIRGGNGAHDLGSPTIGSR